MELSAGQNVPVATATVVVHLRSGRTRLDLIALLLGDDGKVRADEDFVFYNAPHHSSGAVTLTERTLRLDLPIVPVAVERIIVAANSESSLDDLTIQTAGDPELTFTPSGLADLPTALILEVYRRTGGWRIRAVGQGWAAGLAGLARDYGVTVDDNEPEQTPPPPAPTEDLALVRSELQLLTQRRDALTQEVAGLEHQVRDARATIVETDELRLLQQVGYYQFKHPLDDILSSKERLADLRSKIKTAITQRTAVHGKPGWMVNGSRRDGTALVRQFSDLVLRTYNIEADICVRTVRAHSVDAAKRRLEVSRSAIAKSGVTMGVGIDEQFHLLRLEEIQLTADHHMRLEQEKEDRRDQRQRERDEAQAQAELALAKKHLLKEREHYQNLLERSTQNADQAAVIEARARLLDVSERIQEVELVAANTRVGYVYVISNIGAFGDRIFKIGMTRRTKPELRVDELNNASVPFRFDIHALIHSHDAVTLESALHREFDHLRVNQVNRRREFFRVGLAEVRAALEKVGKNHVVEFRELAEAPEWRQSQTPPPSDARPGVHLSR